MRRLILTLALYVLLSILDWASTMWAVESGIADELNPIMAHVLSRGGWGAGLAFKLAVGGLITWLCVALYKQGNKRPAWAAAGISLTGQTLALMFNAAQLARIISRTGG